MEDAIEIRRVGLPAWGKTLILLLPLWLFSLAISAEGFPRPPISIELATIVFYLAAGLSIVLIWIRWMPVELIPYTLIPLLLLYGFDEIATSYKTPFIFTCAMILAAGIVVYQHNRVARWRWLILLAVAAITLFLAAHAVSAFWQMTSDLGYKECFPDAYGCPPLTGQETPWWALFFGF